MQARVTEEHKTNYVIKDGDKELLASVRGSFFAEQAFPKVGDYVVYTELGDGKAAIEEVVERKNFIARKAAHTREEQVIVANVDVMFIVMGLDNDFNLSRLERYLLLAEQSGVKPVVVLNKTDSTEEASDCATKAKEVAGAAPVLAVSATEGEGMEQLLNQIDKGTTVVLLGSSGVGKSTITNWLLREDKQIVRGVREDDSRGRHTTTSRQMFELPNGGYLIDTPGMRELGMVNTTESDEQMVFDKIEALSQECRFRNCDHEKSAGCAVLAAIQAGEIDERQLESYRKLLRERQFAESKQEPDFVRQQRNKQRNLQKEYNRVKSQKRFRR